MEPGAGYIVVWVGQEQKIVAGLTKHTTSRDVVQSLLEEQQTAIGNMNMQLDNLTEYYITEKWRGIQCILPPNTKMLQLWKAWGSEQVNVSFILVKSELRQPCLMWNTAEYHKHRHYPHKSTASVIKSFPLHKQKSIVRRAFRKLEEMKKGMDLQEKHNIKELVKGIASQNVTIKKQCRRIRELDKQIEECITYLHPDKEDKEKQLAHCSHLKKDECEQQTCTFLLETDSHGELKNEANTYMQSEISSNEIREETSIMPRYQREDFCVSEENLNDSWDTCMLQTLRQAVDESLEVEEKLHSLHRWLQTEIHYKDTVLCKQKSEYDVLKQELKLLNELETLVPQLDTKSVSTGNSEELINVALAFSFMSMKSDTDSDTGISSTYSQNSDPVSIPA